MKNYNGIANDRIDRGGSYNKENIGHEIYNFSNYNGKYYGFVQCKGDIHIESLGASNNDDYVDNVTVIWIANNGTKNNLIVGWYENARVYRKLQNIPDNIMDERTEKNINQYNICTEKAVLLPLSIRSNSKENFSISQIFHSTWFNKDDEKHINEQVMKYIENYDRNNELIIDEISSSKVIGGEIDVLVKARVNQGHFRNELLRKFNSRCCLCNLSIPDLLVASHIKPWCVSDNNEKVDEFNGLLLCANHDKLFDRGLISFADDGKILISSLLSNEDRILSNLNDNMRIKNTEESRSYLEYHRKFIFKK
jgi:hypothetical protein